MGGSAYVVTVADVGVSADEASVDTDESAPGLLGLSVSSPVQEVRSKSANTSADMTETLFFIFTIPFVMTVAHFSHRLRFPDECIIGEPSMLSLDDRLCTSLLK